MLKGSKVRAGARLQEPYFKEKRRKATVRETRCLVQKDTFVIPMCQGQEDQSSLA